MSSNKLKNRGPAASASKSDASDAAPRSSSTPEAPVDNSIFGPRGIFATKPGILPPPPPGGIPPAKPFEFSTRVFVKLICFMAALAVVPIWTYYKALADWFPNDTSLSALSAVAAANLVVLGYVIVAVYEGETDGSHPKPAAPVEEKKTQ
ncbi:hypothetical protein BCR44DRAFT_38573 [Catenaria anguillulae PL171]|uniref:Vacuolar ATPase assembly integral membrane protein VMA21 n=1 Tax=Catenaria anguillulae PL171 TaxID=765915 RepID=A0A1Y2HP21_9FUNG|nr:hypothetical protein BCR44DRAFT_38573 [Catenaria anguillulae PL171]